MKKMHSLGFLTALALLVVQSSSWAAVYLKSDVQKKLDNADLVAEILVVGREAVSDPVYFTTLRVQATVERVLNARNNREQSVQVGDRIEIRAAGGERNGVGVLLSGHPRPYLNQHYTAYLNRQEDGVYAITGFDRGLVPLGGSDRQYTRNRTDGTNGEGDGPFLRWDPRFFPVPYYIDANSMRTHADFLPAIDLAFKAWATPKNLTIQFLSMGCSEKARIENDGLNNIILLTSSWPFDADAVAITRSFYVSGDEAHPGAILDADIILNGFAHDFTTTNATGKHDIQSIITHETGHLLGLGHEIDPKDSNAVMYAFAAPNELNKRTLKANDLNGAQEMYQGLADKIPATSSSTMCQLRSGQGGCASVPCPFPPGPLAGIGTLLQFCLLFCGVWIGRLMSARR
jgi:hypothetical protein